jgi:hypothetical protein
MSTRWRRFRGLFGLDSRRDVEDELSFHLEMRIRELVDRGESPRRARELALRSSVISRTRARNVSPSTNHGGAA